MEQGAFHVGDAAVFTDYFVVGGAYAGGPEVFRASDHARIMVMD